MQSAIEKNKEQDVDTKIPGSVRVIEGIVYDTNMEIVFIPLTQADLKKYLDAVTAAQAKAGRHLTNRELCRLVVLLGV